jgi:hypothetical protein
VQEFLLHSWSVIIEYLYPFVSGWTPANWIAFGTACASFALSIQNNRSAKKREREKNKREEFHRRAALPIETALEQFRTVIDELHDVHSSSGKVADMDAVLRRSKVAQRKLSRELRYAASSSLCTSDGWNIGEAEYDRFIETLEVLRDAPDNQYASTLQDAIQALEDHDKVVREKITQELAQYT